MLCAGLLSGWCTPGVPTQARTDTENWCGVLQEVALPGTGGDPGRFLDAAVAFANERCWGSLSCSLVVRHLSACLRAPMPLQASGSWFCVKERR